MSDEQKRFLVAFLFIIIILLVWSYITKPQPTHRATIPISEDTISFKKKEIVPVISVDTIVVEKDNIRYVFSAAGGAIKSFYLRNYKIDIVPPEKYLFTTIISDSVYQFDYKLYSDSLVFTKNFATREIRKVYHFNQDNGFTIKIDADTLLQILSVRDGLAVTETKNKSDDLRHFSVYIQDEKFSKISQNIKEKLEYNSNWKWLAMRNKYFVLILNNLSGIEKTELYKLSALKSEINEAYLGCGVSGNTFRFGIDIYGKENIEISALLLPIRYSELVRFEKGYEQIIGGGIWNPIARVILQILNFFYSLFKNYGIVIIIFAIILKIIFFPLSRQMLISQQKMQLLQPELKKLQQKYKDDPQALNREMMHLYKTYQVNPFSGCLPLLIQFPIFIALYQVLSTSIEFRQAPFVLWITDLSLRDPYYVLPVGMGIMMLIQSLMTTIDPRQKFMVIMMPLVMIFVFLNFPSGLQLYWFTYNILSFIEQLIIKKKIF
uniref:Membrane protein insertase YidC n=1 Tax=candidate division WOR-3 bacterium TaxID=2052148 RepID=A0A7C4XMV4_UNCW3